MINPEILQQLIDLINGQLSTEEQSTLLAKFKSCPALEMEYYLQKDIAHTVIRIERKRMLNEVKEARKKVLSETSDTAYSPLFQSIMNWSWFSIAAFFSVAFSIMGSYFFLISEKHPLSSSDVVQTYLNGDIQKIIESPSVALIDTQSLPVSHLSQSVNTLKTCSFTRKIHRVQSERILAFGMPPAAAQTIKVNYVLTKNEKSYVFDDMHNLTILTNKLSDTSGIFFQLDLADDGFESDTLNGFYLKNTNSIYQLNPRKQGLMLPVDLISPRGRELQKYFKH